jgi:hypothetical protein
MLSVIHAEFGKKAPCAECHYAECPYAERHYAQCHYAECHDAARNTNLFFRLSMMERQIFKECHAVIRTLLILVEVKALCACCTSFCPQKHFF